MRWQFVYLLRDFVVAPHTFLRPRMVETAAAPALGAQVPALPAMWAGRPAVVAFLRHVGELPSPIVPAYTELDLRIGWRPVPRLELSLDGRNLLHAHHAEFGFPGPARQEVPRSLFGRVACRF